MREGVEALHNPLLDAPPPPQKENSAHCSDLQRVAQREIDTQLQEILLPSPLNAKLNDRGTNE